MHIEKILAVYNTSPVLLVVEAEGRAVLELSLQELQAASSPLSDAVRKSLVEDYRIFYCQPAPR